MYFYKNELPNELLCKDYFLSGSIKTSKMLRRKFNKRIAGATQTSTNITERNQMIDSLCSWVRSVRISKMTISTD